MKDIRALISGCALAVAPCIHATDTLDEANKYAAEIDGCALSDGYVCAEPQEDDFLSQASQRRMVHGNLLKSWHSALQDFQSQTDIPASRLDLKHYKIGFSESPVHYIILFQALLLPRIEDGQVFGVRRTTFGRTTRYWINKQSFEVEKRLFYKS